MDVIANICEPAWEASQVRVTAQSSILLDLPSLCWPANQMIAIIGPNGAGKSTLLRVLMGHYPHIEVHCLGCPSAEKVGRGQVAWLGQHEKFELPVTVLDYVLLGCYPHLSWFDRPSALAQAHARELLATFDLTALMDKRIQTLSGGERQRAAIVRALMQQTDLLLFDEPSNHLDIRHQYQIMDALVREQKQRRLSVVMVLHDLNLAANYADHVLLLCQGRRVAEGAPAEVMTAERLSEVYAWPINLHREDGQFFFYSRGVQH